MFPGPKTKSSEITNPTSFTVRESITRQIDRKFRVPKEEKGVWGSQSGDWGSGIPKEGKKKNVFFSAFLSLNQLHNSV